MYFCRISIASHRHSSKTFSKYVYAKLQLHLIEIIRRDFRIMFLLIFKCISSKLFYGIFRTCLCQISIAPHRNYSETFSNYVFANFQLHLVESIPKHFQFMFVPNFNCISATLFWDIFNMYFCRISIASHRHFSRTFSNYVFAMLQLYLIEIVLRHFQVVSLPKFLLSGYPVHTLATGVWTISTNGSLGINVCGFRGWALVLKQEWTLNCTTLRWFFERVLIGVI